MRPANRSSTETGQDWALALNAADPSEPVQRRPDLDRRAGTRAGRRPHRPGSTTSILQVDALDGNTYLGNVVGGDGWSAAGGSPDGMNNTRRRVWLQPSQHQGGIDRERSSPPTSQATRSTPVNPGNPSQDFAIACYNCIVGDPTYSIAADAGHAGSLHPGVGQHEIVRRRRGPRRRSAPTAGTVQSHHHGRYPPE
ncbi:MAG: hypothetical protein U5L08_04580 [Xanthomonadales bacterium]|nr:hypothetical protein [Xanthomonadales bacterium]